MHESVLSLSKCELWFQNSKDNFLFFNTYKFRDIFSSKFPHLLLDNHNSNITILPTKYSVENCFKIEFSKRDENVNKNINNFFLLISKYFQSTTHLVDNFQSKIFSSLLLFFFSIKKNFSLKMSKTIRKVLRMEIENRSQHEKFIEFHIRKKREEKKLNSRKVER